MKSLIEYLENLKIKFNISILNNDYNEFVNLQQQMFKIQLDIMKLRKELYGD